MNIVIIEDESTAAKNLKYLLKEIEPSIVIKATIETVKEALDFFNKPHHIDLAFFDIHLADGNSFEIFEKTKIHIPIIFTTAYDEYAIKAFKVNSIGYLLKPIDEDELKGALSKYKNSQQITPLTNQFQQMLQLLNAEKKVYKNVYLIQQRDNLIPLNVDNVAYFVLDAGIVKAVTLDDKSLILDKKMEDLEEELNPSYFFRANRQYIVQRKAIENLQLYFNRKMILNVTPKAPEQIIISKVKAPQLKSWIHNQ